MTSQPSSTTPAQIVAANHSQSAPLVGWYDLDNQAFYLHQHQAEFAIEGGNRVLLMQEVRT